MNLDGFADWLPIYSYLRFDLYHRVRRFSRHINASHVGTVLTLEHRSETLLCSLAAGLVVSAQTVVTRLLSQRVLCDWDRQTVDSER